MAGIITSGLIGGGSGVNVEDFLDDQFAFPSHQDIVSTPGEAVYEVSLDENATVAVPIVDGAAIVGDLATFTVETLAGRMLYREGSFLNKASNLVSVTAYNPATREITLNYPPKVDFRLSYLTTYTRDEVPEGKYLRGSGVLNVKQVEDVNVNVSDTKKTKTTVNIETKTVASYSSLEYRGVRWCYTIDNATDLRTGEILVSSDGTTVNSTEMSTGDIGDTATVEFDTIINGTDIELQATSSTVNWDITVRQDTI